MTPRIVHNGDAGDCIAALLIARHLGNVEMVLTHSPPNHRSFKLIGHMILPLINAQPYISAAMWMDAPSGATHELMYWRRGFYRSDRSLAESQADYLGIKLTDFSPWLTVEPDKSATGRVIVSRSPRYQNPQFPWREVGQKYKNDMLFIGLPEEHASLQRVSGRQIEHRKVNDHLEIASLILGSRMLISNQTAVTWIAQGLGHPLVQECEVKRRIWDAQLPRSNAIYFKGGTLKLP